MKSNKRLFLFAAYDKDDKIDSSLIYYVSKISKLGDVIFCMDGNCTDKELEKIKPYCLYAFAMRHSEYDFGSYKKAFAYAVDRHILKDYDFVYMLNDSVYGPTLPLAPIFEKIENKNTDAFGLVSKRHYDHPHIQSWFIGMRPSVFMSDWFNEFILSVEKQSDKGHITGKYEHGFTKLIFKHNLKCTSLLTVRNRGVYNKVKKLFCFGIPFIKKNSFIRRNGALGRQILYVLNHIQDMKAREMILDNANRTWDTEYVNWLLTKNPIKILFRNIKHSIRKLFIEGI